MLRSDLCHYSDMYSVVKKTITAKGINANNRTDKNLALKNNAMFSSCISKINNTFVDNAEDLDIVMSMYILLEYSNNYPMTSASL